ncbi:MAG TPA: hypothetical protein VGN11_07455, partial [Candidatus Baltobacteraceae bacterium]|nr:hypothetical protein [Candidatus Baltobacteraceae bacterium]
SGAASLSSKGWSPSIAAQGGVENNAGASYIGKIHSSVFGLQVSVSPLKSISLSAGFDTTPWHRDTIVLPKGVSCDSGGATSTYQLSTQTTLPYFLPQGVAQCLSHSDGSTSVYYGGWATPYSDSYATDPLFTTGFAEGAPDRRSPGNSSIVDGTYTSGNGRLTLFSSYTRHDYSNAIARQETTEWGTLAGYRFNEVRSGAYYKGLLLRCFYVVQRKSNVAYASGASYLGGLPLIRYSRIQLEYTL